MLICIVVQIRSTQSLDIEIEDMRLEGLEKHDVSLFVEEKVIYIHSRISLKHMIIGIEHADKLMRNFGSRTNSTFSRILATKLRRSSTKVEQKMRDLYGYSHTKRDKRAIEFVGNLISKLFGNPGPEDWKQNKKNIIAMKRAIERQMENSAQLHKDIDQNRHTINEQNEILRRVTKEVVNNENRINNVDNALTSLELFLELETMYDSIDEILESLIDIKADAKGGRCNEKGLNPEFLIDHLREIESNKNSIGPIFESWEWQRYYEHELCTLALHDSDVWITMRIPIVDQTEQYVRCVPNSNQLWFRNELNELGFETTLLKNRNHESFMIILRYNLELCSKLGSTRVCNIRRTKFRENNPFLVPIDINHGRVLIVSNSTANYTVKTICKGNPSSLEIQSHTVLKIPASCTLISKSIEISKLAENASLAVDMSTNEVQEVSLRRIKKSKIDNFNIPKNIVESSNIVDINNNATKADLNEVKVESSWTVEKILLTSTTSSSLVLGAIVVIGIVICIRKNKSKKQITVVEIKNPRSDINLDGDNGLHKSYSDFASDTSDLQQCNEKQRKFEPQFKSPSK